MAEHIRLDFLRRRRHIENRCGSRILYGYMRAVGLKELQEKASDERLTAEERIQLVIRINNLNIKLDELNQTESERGEGFEH